MSEMKKAAIIIAQDMFRDEELFDTQKALEMAHVKTTVVSSKLGNCKGKLGSVANASMLIEEVSAEDFDAIVFVGGSGAMEYYDNSIALDLARNASKKGRIVAAICIAPRILANAGLLKGLKVTCFESEADAIKKLGADFTGADVERDGKIITGNGPHAATQFGETIGQALAE